jgi:hypothetical protein
MEAFPRLEYQIDGTASLDIIKQSSKKGENI